MSTSSFDEPAPTARGFNWQDSYHAILDRLWIVLVCAALGLIAAFVHLRGQEQLYGARAVLVLEDRQGSALSGVVESVSQERIQSLDMINTVVDQMGSHLFAERVADHLDLADDPAFLEAIGSEEPLTTAQVANHIRGMISVSFRRNTRLIDIIAKSRNPQIATAVANGYASEFIRMKLEQSTEATRAAAAYLLAEADRLGETLRTSEEAMQSFRIRERATSLDNMLADAEQTHDSNTEALRQIRAQITQLETDLAAAARVEGDTEALIKLPSVAADPRIISISMTLSQMDQDIVVLGQRYREGHPVFADLASRRALAEADLTEVLSTIVDRLAVQRDRLAEIAADLASATADSEERLLDVTGKFVEYNSISRDLETNKALHEAVLSRFKEVDLTKGAANEPFSVHELATGAGPIPIEWTKTLIMGFVGGLALGVGAALGLAKLDPSIHTVEQAEDITGLRVITAVPQLKDTKPGLITVRDRHGAVAEAFRTLRASLALLGDAEQRRVFLFTSAMPSEGKTFSSANFAATLAQQGFRTLYIDGDLRKPAVSALIFGENRKPGFTEVLRGSCPLAEAAIPSGTDNLDIITAGGRSENPAELLATAKVKDVLDEARRLYDRVVIDSAPVIAVSDSLLLAAFVDISCLILRANRTSRKSVKHAIRLLSELGHPPAGIVLNGLHDGRGSYYSHYAYSGRVYGEYGARGVYGR